MEKLSKNVHNHTFTDLLKVCVFALLLLLPGIMFLPSCFYYGFNEHATNTETTTINYKYESNEVNSLDDLVVGNIYEFDLQRYFDESTVHDYIDLYNIEAIVTYDNEVNSNHVQYFTTYFLDIFTMLDGTTYYISLSNDYYGVDTFEIKVFDSDLQYIHLFLTYQSYELDSTFEDYSPYFKYTDYNVIESVTVNTDDTISTKLYRSWEQLWNTQLFSWTNNTPLNTGINGFIGVFGINSQSYIGNLLIWLLSITAIYVVIDIVIGVFKWLTHLIGNH